MEMKKQVLFYKIKNNIVVQNFPSLGIYFSKDGKLIIPIFIFTAIVKFLIFNKLVDYKIFQEIINEYKLTVNES